MPKAAKGFLASDAAKVRCKRSGKNRDLTTTGATSKNLLLRLEQNFYDAVRATTDVYDKGITNVKRSRISNWLEAAQEGDQRGVAATAGKVKQVQDAGTQDRIADKHGNAKT